MEDVPEESVPGESSAAACPGFDFRPTGLEQVRNWIRKQRFIPNDLYDEFIRKFLDVKNGDVQKASAMMGKYFHLRQQPNQIFRDVNPSSADNRKLFGPLYAVPVMNEGGIVLLTGLMHRTTKYNLPVHLKLILLTIECLLWDREISFTELKVILDGRNFVCATLLDDPGRREWLPFIRDRLSSIPINLDGFYVLRPPEHAREILRVYDGIWLTVFHGEEEALEKFPSAILPFEYGGSFGFLGELLDTWRHRLEERSEFFVRLEKRMANDYRRRTCRERELKEGGKNWVHKMKLASEESEYKERYYRMMANLKPLVHPAYGSQRLKNKTLTAGKCEIGRSHSKTSESEITFHASQNPAATFRIPRGGKKRKSRVVTAASCHDHGGH